MELLTTKIIESRIFTFQGKQVMVDRDLAELFQVEVKRLNEQVKRNSLRFPAHFRFQLSDTEKNELVANCDRFEILKHSSSNPYVFTEQGVAMLSAVLRSEKAIMVSIQIMNTFVEMRKVLAHHSGLLQRVESIESRLQLNDQHFEKIFTALEQGKPTVKQDVFFKGQIFDAYSFVIDLIKKAEITLVIIDSYIDLSILEMLTEKSKIVSVTIITQKNTPIKALDIEKFNAQYGKLEIKHSQDFHDRFLIIDHKELYHIGASLKDLGKKCFAFSMVEDKSLLQNLINKI
ncbi:ORF6N domain-containing protein [Belliella pelovolcani]|uniref:ORF6N domain-containing protein n=1 Tax=Belliella pelovolcani TaxID=529505 RepID=A0A1N7L822_9BACT|nr:ORF6N domain-containing protein [Belliella pelovolcani]SIS69985.1 ORF6N domain-containing protein [Belliella pelovolcani]